MNHDNVPGFHNPEIWETLPNARLSPTARDVLDVLTTRQNAGGLVEIRQHEIAKRLGISQAAVSRAIGQLKDKGILDGRHRQGAVLIHPLLAGYESMTHMINHLQDPSTFVWPLNFPTGDMRPPRVSDARSGTGFDPDPDDGEDAPLPDTRPTLRLAG
ncbi:winged helix-turn-helix domain-containing protein (plasmid) [Streptomyces sp. NBC_01525]|uniref:Winged helix-turn-helix transcriptional regulator n=1 Tax=Streptomyces benahoarensis TaxID=2595054 RepID=A0A553ZPP6_9ACTN|nr:winged helix-turn-helix domain-containing protein [Streptomyces benahoarensis]TSB25638.1 winged helix-turn-helix transcriptional regulator [Streptomyces benahoarensis]TSB43403.1 winged helix-turn-helix transcriptional regulator [Streptomyces benahoarensis]